MTAVQTKGALRALYASEEGSILSEEVYKADETMADWAMRAANTRLDLIDLGCMGRHEPEVEARPGGESGAHLWDISVRGLVMRCASSVGSTGRQELRTAMTDATLREALPLEIGSRGRRARPLGVSTFCRSVAPSDPKNNRCAKGFAGRNDLSQFTAFTPRGHKVVSRHPRVALPEPRNGGEPRPGRTRARAAGW